MVVKFAWLGVLALSAAILVPIVVYFLASAGLLPWFEFKLFGRSYVVGKRQSAIVRTSADTLGIFAFESIRTSSLASLGEASIAPSAARQPILNIMGSSDQIFQTGKIFTEAA